MKDAVWKRVYCDYWAFHKYAKQAGAELGQAQLKLELRLLTGAKRSSSILKEDRRRSKTAKI